MSTADSSARDLHVTRSMYVERVDAQNEQEYRRFVRNCETAVVQQSWEWGQVVAGVGQDKPAHLIARGPNGLIVGALPAFIFDAEPGSVMVSVPQAGGYGGVVLAADADPDQVYALLLDAFVQEARRHGCALATICTPPFFGDVERYRRHFRPDFERENFYQYLDVGGDIPPATNRRTRRNMRAAGTHGLKVVFEDNENRFASWYEIHEKRMRELDAIPLPRSIFEGARRLLLPQGLGFFGYVLDNEQIVAGALFVGLNRVLDVYLMSSDSAQADRHPNTLLISEALQRARSLSYSYFNWQSSSSRESGVYEFKRGWGSREAVHYYLTRITGDLSRLRQTPVQKVKRLYPWHYVMPYEEFGRQIQEAGGLGGAYQGNVRA